MKLKWPLDNIRNLAPIAPNGSEVYISQEFADPRGGYYSKYGLKGHNGIDIAAPLGTPIHSTLDGFIVEQTAKETGFGLRITQRIELNGKFYQVIYGHMQRLQDPTDIAFNWGLQSKPVKKGDVIGYVNSTGDSTGNHLHFGLYEMSLNGTTLNINNGYGGAIDPKPFMQSPYLLETTHMKVFIDKKTTPPTIYTAFGVDTEDNLKWFASQNGKELPLKADGSIDFASIVYDGELK